MSKNVEHPHHYTSGGVECIDGIRAALGDEGFCDYCRGNCIKYLWRYKMKGGIEDLEKAMVYLQWLIDTEKRLQGDKLKIATERDIADLKKRLKTASSNTKKSKKHKKKRKSKKEKKHA